jgi:hypothetical protein
VDFVPGACFPSSLNIFFSSSSRIPFLRQCSATSCSRGPGILTCRLISFFMTLPPNNKTLPAGKCSLEVAKIQPLPSESGIEKKPLCRAKGLSRINANPGDRASRDGLAIPSEAVLGGPIDPDDPTDGCSGAAAAASGWGGNRPTGSGGNRGRKPNRPFRRLVLPGRQWFRSAWHLPRLQKDKLRSNWPLRLSCASVPPECTR